MHSPLQDLHWGASSHNLSDYTESNSLLVCSLLSIYWVFPRHTNWTGWHQSSLLHSSSTSILLFLTEDTQIYFSCPYLLLVQSCWKNGRFWYQQQQTLLGHKKKLQTCKYPCLLVTVLSRDASERDSKGKKPVKVWTCARRWGKGQGKPTVPPQGSSCQSSHTSNLQFHTLETNVNA